MKKTISIIVIILLFAIPRAESSEKEKPKGPTPEEWTLKLKIIPETVEEFTEMRDKVAKTPEGGALMFIAALNMYAQDNEEGTKALVVAIDKQHLSKNKKSGMYKNYSIRNFYTISQMRHKPYIARSYIDGTSPENSYALGKPPYTVKMFTTVHSFYHKGRFRIMVHCSGADSPRPITVRANKKGIWKAYEYSSLVMGIRKPVEEDEEDDDL
ncbi:DUF6935 domain-containing protein [Spirochaetota bacterium]